MCATESTNKKEQPCWIDFYERGKFTECDCNYEKNCRECERYSEDTRKEFERVCEKMKGEEHE